MKKMLIVLSMLVILLAMASCSENVNDDSSVTTVAETNVSEIAEQSTVPLTSTIEKTTSATTTTTAGTTTKKNTKKTEKQTVSEKSVKNKTTTKKYVTTTKAVQDIKSDDSTVTVKGSVLKIGMSVDDGLISKLGKTIDVEEAPSCHGDGKDYIYTYNDFVLYTYEDNGNNKLSIVEISSPTITTSKGAKVGMSVSQVKSLHGNPAEESEMNLIYKISGVSLRFTIEDETVTLIEYSE